MGRLYFEHRRRTWYLEPQNMITLLVAMIEEASNTDELKRIVGEIVTEPWKWHAEFVCAKCRELDG